jgi:hypothetical protein
MREFVCEREDLILNPLVLVKEKTSELEICDEVLEFS